MAFDKHKTPSATKHEDHPVEKKEKTKKPFGDGSDSTKGSNLDSYDKEQKIDKELGEKKPGKKNTFQ